MTVRVLLCDDHAMVREGLERLLNSREGIEVVGTAADGDEAVAVAAELHPDVVMMDFSMPRLDGIEATRRIVAATPGTRIVMLTSFREDARVLDALSAGAIGFMLKDADGDELVRAIEAAARGDVPLDPRAARAVLTQSAASDPREGMTARERDVLELIGTGLPNKVIAVRLGISEATVKAHLTRIYRQIGVTDRTQAAIWAREHPDTGGRGGP
jgi:DNA-binding NarL/FixJ family response regulator